jgi:RHS repeat-associated protein
MEGTMVRHGASVFSHGIIVVKDFIARNAARPPFPTSSPVNPVASCKRPLRRGLVRRAVALITATVFGILPPLQAAAQVTGQLNVRQQVARADRSFLRAPRTVAAPHSRDVKEGMAYRVAHDGAVLDIPAGALSADTTLSITPLPAVAATNGVFNITPGPRQGYRMGPPGQRFARPITITLPYDLTKLPEDVSDVDLRIFWYDTEAKRWTALERVAIDRRAQTVSALTDHFTDFIAGVVVVPNHQQVEGYAPTQIAGLKAADPGAKINLIDPPQANASGDAVFAYPIELPPGRNGHQPSLAITYDSSRGNGWLGTGWGLDLPSIEIDTRWGVPRYDTGQIDPSRGALETETYLFSGAQLAPVANRGNLLPRRTTPANQGDCQAPCTTFSLRVEGEFHKIVRHGDRPSTYWWEVTAKDGTRSLYGGSLATNTVDPQAVLADPATGNIARWLLREVIDPNGNNIRFNYDVVDVTAFHGGTEPARQIYPSSIRYTGRSGGADGSYQVLFTRDHVRTDPIVDGRFGFKTVTTDRLTGIDVNLLTEANPLIRHYTLDYVTGQFNKSLLQKITQIGADGTTEFNHHSFDYFDEVGSPSGITIFGGDVVVPGGGTTSGSGLASDATGTAFSGEANANAQTHLYTGIAVGSPQKELSGGFKVGANTDTSHLSEILIDLNGDGRLDQVFLTGDGVYWRPNTGTPTAPSFGTMQKIATLPAINKSSGSTFTAGGEVFAGTIGLGAAVLLDKSFGRINEQVYFIDVNGDGLPDLVNNGTVLFNQGLDANGNPFFAPGSPTPLGSGAAPNTAGLITVTPDQQTAAQAAFPLVDSVRRWVAPFTGTIDITGPIALAQAGDASADGVRVAIQLENSEIFSLTIAPNDTSTKQITGLTGISVTAGQRLYFRVDSINDGAFDTVSFDPTITYRMVNGVAVNPATLDENGLPVFVTTASADYAYGGRSLPVAASVAGTATVSGTITKPNVTTDDVSFTVSVIPANSPPGTPGTPVFSQTILAGNIGSAPVSVPLNNLNPGDQIVARINTDTRIDLSGIGFTATLAYNTIAGAPAPTNPNGSPAVTQELPVAAQVFPVSTSPNPPTPWIAPGGPIEVTQIVSGAGAADFNGRIALAAKSGGVLLTKQLINVVNGAIAGVDRLDVVFNLPAGTPVFFTAEATNPSTLAAFNIGAPTTAGGDVLPFDVRLDTSNVDPFGGGYRNWWFADYTPTDPAAPIDQTLLRLPTSQSDQVFGQFMGMLPFQAENSWQARAANNAFVIDGQTTPASAFVSNTFNGMSGSFMGSTRLGARTMNVDSTSFGGAQGIVKTGSSVNTAFGPSFTLILGSFGFATSNGTTGSDIDFFDFNGDGYPDVVSGGSLQATLPNGALGSQRFSLAGQSQVRQSATVSNNLNLGATTSAVRAGSDDFPLNIFSEQAAYNIGVGVSASSSTATMKWDLVDVNGDGLLDLVQPVSGGLIVRLNLGYRFGQPEIWTATNYVGVVRQVRTVANGIGFSGGVGFTTPDYSFGGGFSSTKDQAATEQDLIDVNGDGLPDLVIKTLDTNVSSVSSPDPHIQVFLNTGAGFLAGQTWNGALPVPIQSRSGLHRNVGLHFSIPIFIGFTPTVPPVPLWLIINPGHNNGDSFASSQSQLRDFNGDGYADHISSSGSAVTVHLNQRGRTNLLKSITRPLGATIALDYVRAGNTPAMPQNRWVMSSRIVFDGLAGDGADYQIATFDYVNGQWNRAERTFYGFATVTERHHDTTGVTTANIGTTVAPSLPVFREIVQSFRTDSFYTKGLLTQQITQTGAGARFLETDNTYNVVTVPNGTGQPGLEDFTETRFPQLVQRNRLFFEGQPTAGKQTTETFAYDGFGNVTQHADLGDAGAADDVFATIHHSGGPGGNPACVARYIVGIADRVTVTDAAGNTLRRREADVDCTTANITENRRFLADGSVAVSDMTYDSEGKLTNIVGPANLNGQRYSLTYTYDPVVRVHVESVTDSFNYVSTSTHDFKFAEITSVTDDNGQVITNTYDDFGRISKVIGPYEQGTTNTTATFTYSPFAAVPWALTSHFDTFGANPNGRIETALFTDGLKRVVQTKKDAAVAPQAGTAPIHVMTVSGRVIFDPFGRTTQQFYPGTEPLGQQGTLNSNFDSVQPAVTAFDILDRVTKVTIPDNTTTTTSYDFGADRGGQTRFRTTMIDARGVRKEMFHDVRALITTVNEFNNGGSAVFHTSYAYDPMSQITRVTDDQGNVTSVSYDLFGRRTAIDSPDAGRNTFTYDLADNLTAKQTANLRTAGQQVTYAFEFNRLTAINYPAFPANNVTYTYGAASQRQPGPVGNVVGRITHITDGAGTEDRLYGPLGETVQQTRAIPIQGGQVITYVMQYQYDTWNRIQQITYPDQPAGEAVNYFYDAGGLVTRVHGNDDQVEVNYASNITYDKFGQRLSMTYGNGAINTYAYDPLTQRLAQVKATLAIGYTFNDFAFTYDNVGNLTRLQNNAQFPGSFTGGNLGNAIGGPWTKTYAYDDLYRLTNSTGTHSVAPTQTYTYSFSQAYDSIHNITHKTQSAMQGTAVNPQTTYDFAYSYPAPGSARPHAPTAIGPSTITSDANGNHIQTLDTGTSDQSQYLYDEENRLSCANKGPQTPSPSCNAQGQTEFIYDQAGVRKLKVAASPTIYPTQYYTDFGGGAGNQFKHIFIGTERILTKKARVAPDRQHWYYHSDHLRSTAMVTNENGQLVDALHYFPFGEVWLEERPSSLPADYFFTAKEFDPETGFYDFGARYLDPRFSKWMTADPALGAYLPSEGKGVGYQSPSLANNWRSDPDLPGRGGVITPVNLGLYGYAGQNPATLVDPDGRTMADCVRFVLRECRILDGGGAGGGGGRGNLDLWKAFKAWWNRPSANRPVAPSESGPKTAPAETAQEPTAKTGDVKRGSASDRDIIVRGPNGEILSVKGQVRPEDIGTGTGTNASSRAAARAKGLPTDDAGHTRPMEAGGSGRTKYTFPQDPHTNQGTFNKFEEKWIKDVKSTKQPVEFEQKFDYGNGPGVPGNTTRPNSIDYTVRDPNGKVIYQQTFPNPR